jgi:hypothetical protein
MTPWETPVSRGASFGALPHSMNLFFKKDHIDLMVVRCHGRQIAVSENIQRIFF